MEESEYIERVTRALKQVPEKSLLIIELANQIPVINGQMDPEYISAREPEINAAIAEAKMYGAYTLTAVDRLRRIKEDSEEEPEDV